MSLTVVGNGANMYAMFHFLLVIRSNVVSILRRFSDITTFTVSSLPVTLRSSSWSIQYLAL